MSIKMNLILEDDPITCYLIVRESLLEQMGTGKLCAQCAHGSQMLMQKYNDELQIVFLSATNQISFNKKKELMEEWIANGIRKVVLKADDKEWAKIKIEYPDHILVKDIGLTKIPAGSETCITLFPMHKSHATKTIKRLQVLSITND